MCILHLYSNVEFKLFWCFYCNIHCVSTDPHASDKSSLWGRGAVDWG